MTEEHFLSHVHTLSQTLDRRLQLLLADVRSRGPSANARGATDLDQLVLKVASIHGGILAEIASGKPLRREALTTMLEMQLGALRLLDQIEAVRAKEHAPLEPLRPQTTAPMYSRSPEPAPYPRIAPWPDPAPHPAYPTPQGYQPIYDPAPQAPTYVGAASQPAYGYHQPPPATNAGIYDADYEVIAQPSPAAYRQPPPSHAHSSQAHSSQAHLANNFRGPYAEPIPEPPARNPYPQSTSRALTVVAPSEPEAPSLLDQARRFARPALAATAALFAGIWITSFFLGGEEETEPAQQVADTGKRDGRLETAAPAMSASTTGQATPAIGVSTETPAPEADSAVYVAVIATVPKQAAAQEAVSALRAKYPAILLGSSRQAGVQPIQRHDGVIVYRAHLMPPLPQAAAKDLCRRLREAGHLTCWVKPQS